MTHLFRPTAKLQLPGLGNAGAVSTLPIVGKLDTGQSQGTENRQRRRTWELSPTYHCSIIGTCLPAAELRQVLVKAGDASAQKASDHVLHGSGVRAAGRQDVTGKLLNKALDRRHEKIIRRFSRAGSASDIRILWREAFDSGDIAGAYWAVLSHPIQDQDLIRDVFGEVHMLSHLIGSASRLDIARLAKLEAAVQERDEVIAKQQFRLQEAAREKSELAQTISILQEHLVASTSKASSEPKNIPAALRQESDLKHRMESLVEELQAARELIHELEALKQESALQIDALTREVGILDRLACPEEDVTLDQSGDISGQTVLYVGGRRHHYDRIRSVAEKSGLEILFHDGGLEDNTSLLPGLIGQADTIVFPVDHISHAAAGLAKRYCQSFGKPFTPLRSAGMGSFAAAMSIRPFQQEA